MLHKVCLYLGDCIESAKKLPSESVHTIITSPPYWGLRDYGVEGQIGLEESFDEWLSKMVELFEELKRVLHKSGTLWVNMGDSFNASATRGSFGDQSKHGYVEHGYKKESIKGLHKKNLIGQPWKLAFALQESGWILRSDIVWYKTNAMPESITDRPTRAHEFIFLFSKKERYFFNWLANEDKPVSSHRSGNGFNRKERLKFIDPDGTVRGHDQEWMPSNAKRPRSVWDIPTKPFPEAHFATFPPELPRRMIRLGTSDHGCCANCLSPYEPIIEKDGSTYHGGKRKRADAPGAVVSASSVFRTGEATQYKIGGWKQSCKCNAEIKSCIVLDPFSGSGTTGLEAVRNQRDYIGFELNPEYLQMSEARLRKEVGLFIDMSIVDC